MPPKTNAKKPAIAISGLRSYLAKELIRHLIDQGYTIVGIDLDRANIFADHFKFYKVDLTLPTAGSIIADIFQSERVQKLIHLAFLKRPNFNANAQHELQVIGTWHLLHACSSASLKQIIVQSSTMVYGARSLNPNYLSEQHPLQANPKYRWVSDFVEVEQLLERYRIKNPQTKVTTLRFAPILGRNIKNLFTELFCRPAVTTTLGFDPLYQMLHEDDAVAAILQTLDHPISATFNIVGKDVLPLSSLIYLTNKVNLPLPNIIAGSLIASLWISHASLVPPEHVPYWRYLWVADGEKAQKELGYQPKYNIKEILAAFSGAQKLKNLQLLGNSS